MILSSPFSRQNRSHQTWTNGLSSQHHQNSNQNHANLHHSPRKPAPPEPAPEQPKPMLANGHSNTTTGNSSFRSHTLNRLDLLKRRQEQRAASSGRASLQRNVSSLGHYPAASSSKQQYGSPKSEIYAPASIASPAELAKYRSSMQNGESQHYASASCHQAGSESSRRTYTRPESALGNLWERIGTLRTKWSKSSSSSRKSDSPMVFAKGSTMANGQGSIKTTPADAVNNIALDPEIYGTGKKRVEAEEIYAEGQRAIDSNIQKRLIEHEIDEAIMAEGETRTLIEESSKRQSNYQQLVSTLTNWINDELSQRRIIVKDLQDDLHDGQILGHLVEHLHNIKLDIVEVTQNELTQRYKLRTVLETINRILTLQARWARIRWSVDGIHSKNLIEIIHLLVTLAIYYKAPVKLPPNVMVNVLVVQKCQANLVKRSHQIQLTDSRPNGQEDLSVQQKHKRDVFDTLIEVAPEKLDLVKHALVKFANRHLNKIRMSCTADRANEILDPEKFSDGLLLVFLIASLENYFVPLGNLFTSTITTTPRMPSPETNENGFVETALDSLHPQTAIDPTSYINTQPIHKLHNVNVAIQLIEEAGIEIRNQVRAEDVVNGDLKTVLRILYALFNRYKHL